MNSLRDIGTFVGIPQGSLEISRYGGPRDIWMTSVSDLATSSGAAPLRSLQAISQAPEYLAAVTLDAQIIGVSSGQEPFEVVVRVTGSGGIVRFTSVLFHLGGKLVSAKDDVGSAGGDVSFQLGAGDWTLVVNRVGISNTGFVSLSKTLSAVHVSAKPKSDPPKPNPGSVMSTITVQSSTVTATGGAFKDFATGKICRRAGNLFFEASDGRVVNGSQLSGNTVQTSCPA